MLALEPNLLNFSTLAVAFAAAVTGSLHCVGMCGPLRLLCGDSPGNRIAYQLGRGSAYLVLGGIAGTMGSIVPVWLLWGVIGLGIVLSLWNAQIFSGWQRGRLLLQRLSASHPLFLGMASGILPCGLLHGWIAVAAATMNPWRGALVLGVLWLGTLPALEVFPGVAAKPIAKLRARYPRAVPIAFLLLAMAPLVHRMGMSQPSSPHSSVTHSCH